MRIQTAIIVLAVGVLPGWGLAPAFAARVAEGVALQEKIRVIADTIRLSDLLPATASAEIRMRAGQIVLGHAPQPGSLRVFLREQLRHRLREHPGLLAALRIPERILVERRQRRLAPDEILEAIRRALEQNGFGEVVTLTAEDLEQIAPVLVTTDEPGLQVTRIEFDSAHRQTRFRLWTANEKQNLPFYVTSRVRIHWPVVVTARELEPGVAIADGDLRVEKRLTALDLSRIPMRLADLVGMKTDRRIRTGEVVRPEMFSPVRLVEPGTLAWLLLENERIRITTRVMPLQAGVRGQRIRVRSLDTGRIFQAVVVAHQYLRASL